MAIEEEVEALPETPLDEALELPAELFAGNPIEPRP